MKANERELTPEERVLKTARNRIEERLRKDVPFLKKVATQEGYL
jgi:hypothetical protein